MPSGVINYPRPLFSAFCRAYGSGRRLIASVPFIRLGFSYATRFVLRHDDRRTPQRRGITCAMSPMPSAERAIRRDVRGASKRLRRELHAQGRIQMNNSSVPFFPRFRIGANSAR
jgi:hypothetical protein